MPPLTGPVLVTGAGGMIGSAVVRRLHAAGIPVWAHLGPPGADGVSAPPGVRTSVAEVTDAPAMSALVAGAEVVVHLAGPASVAASFSDPVAFAQTHVVGTATVVHGCVGAGVRRVVHISSAEVYGRPARSPVSESAPTAPRSPYGAAKLGAEALVRAHALAGDLDAVILRPFSAYGPQSPARSLVATLVRQALLADVVEVVSLRPVRDYVHVDDIARAVALALQCPAADAPVLNVGTGIGTSVERLARLTLGATGHDVPVRETRSADRPESADLNLLIADITNAENVLGWRPEIDLLDGVTSVVQHLGETLLKAPPAK